VGFGAQLLNIMQQQHMSSMEDSLVPFRQFIPPETSTFQVSVPFRDLNGRKFHFERLALSPDFYSKEAASFGVEAAEEELVVYKTDLRLEADFVGDKKNFGPSFKLQTLLTAREFITEFNSFFENDKSDFMKRCPVFFDWTDISLSHPVNYIKEASVHEEVWYGLGTSYSWEMHGNGLPASLADLPVANPLKYPPAGVFGGEEETKENFRVRLFLAPFLKVTFSVLGPLQDLGFSVSQFGEQKTARQITIINPSAFYVNITASSPPSVKLASSSCTINVFPSDPRVMSFNRTLEISAADYKNHEILAERLNAKIQECAEELNVNFSLQFDLGSNKFHFSFPSSDQISLLLFLQKPELSLRMGFYYNNIISKTSKAKEMAAVGPLASNMTDLLNKCTSLCYDTGIVLCTLDQASSNATSGAMDYFMASLLPTSSGVMEMDKCGLEELPGVVLNSPSGFGSRIPFKFQLLRIYDNQELRKFAWKNGAWIYGMLKGVLVSPVAAVAGSSRRFPFSLL
jgi:hypothetical protein